MPPRRQLSERLIAGAALQIVDDEGLDALTMRRVAGELGTGAMSLYNYFADKDALLDAVVQLVLAEIEAPPAELGWKEVVRRIMHSVRRTALRHPHVAPLLPRFPPRTLDALAFVEAGFRATRAAGFDAVMTASVYRLLASYSFGALDVELNSYFDAPPVAAQAADSVSAPTLAKHLPALAEMGPYVQNSDHDEEFSRGLELLLATVDQLMSPGQPGVLTGRG